MPARALTVLLVLGGLGAATAGAAAAPKVVYLDYNGQSLGAKPKRIFLTANAGPYLRGLRWTGWGTREARATGTYVSDCASCMGPARRSATVIFRRLMTCTNPADRGGRYRIYRVGRLTTTRDGGGARRTIALPTNTVLCDEG